MKKYIPAAIIAVLFFCAGLIVSAFARNTKNQQDPGYILDHEKEIAQQQPGPHDGGGTTTAHNFFAKAADCKLVFRKRILHPGSSIGYHLQKEDEIYYVVSGTGEMKMNGKTFPVTAGDAILTRPGSSHGLTQTGKEDLVIIINYEKK
ncbi:MAG TPA: cupin domain-containing protein [Chitinophagaceae bacterium]|jgi:mannose-6-phosphate isomerase-like protein (cupin superfamily)|nr:cupin domain-containing protein [Chitinophagaceae bacterium]